MKKAICILLASLMIITAFAGCGKEETETNGKVKVVATLFPQYDFARNIAGDLADVSMLLDFGTDAHSFDPTLSDIADITDADLFIYTGGAMEPWATELLKGADVTRAVESGALRVLDLSEAVDLLPLNESGETEPHIWTSFTNGVLMCEAIASALSEIDPDNGDYYEKNMLDYSEKLITLAGTMNSIVDNAKNQCAYFGGSFAFTYLFDSYGLEHLSLFEGCAAHTEPSLGAIDKMVEEMKAAGATYVLYDSAAEQKTAETIAAEIGGDALHLHAIHNITKAEFDAGEDYVSLSEKNLEVLKKALD